MIVLRNDFFFLKKIILLMAIHHFNELRTIIRSLLALNASVELVLLFIICLEKKKSPAKRRLFPQLFAILSRVFITGYSLTRSTRFPIVGRQIRSNKMRNRTEYKVQFLKNVTFHLLKFDFCIYLK